MILKFKFFLTLIIVIGFFWNGQGQKKIIFDTDFGGDADDLGALAMLNHFIDRKECNLLAVMCWSTEKYAVEAIDAVNRFYGHPDIPIGVRRGTPHYDSASYSKPIADQFPHQVTYDKSPEATPLYRKILAKSKNNSVRIVAVGPLKNIENLLKSGPDEYSRLSGMELVKRKVKEFVIMGGQFPDGKDEWNFNGNMPGVTRFVIANIPVPVIFTGFEVGNAIKTGEVFNDLDTNTPLYVGFMHFSEHAFWMRHLYTPGRISKNSTFDQTAVLYAIRNGTELYWDKVEGGICVPDDTGGNTWVNQKNSKHAYLKLKLDPELMANEIENFMLGQF
jgi:inosine-uridine nucleoside N-ribohydrolase